ncbi:MAG: UDP-2,3-diacylglucosamine diphosphatase, partial [Flavisolibacter sp.]|nr:UDP-2,3-diacylglucosamine diphosphatase [Flavisolibacter sp.]
MQLPSGRKIFFLSDFHLGAPDASSSLKREILIIQFLDEIKEAAAAI